VSDPLEHQAYHRRAALPIHWFAQRNTLQQCGISLPQRRSTCFVNSTLTCTGGRFGNRNGPYLKPTTFHAMIFVNLLILKEVIHVYEDAPTGAAC
jgi:hypothetical protein